MATYYVNKHVPIPHSAIVSSSEDMSSEGCGSNMYETMLVEAC